MSKRRAHNDSIQAAIARLHAVKGKILGSEEQIEIAQDLAGLILEGAKKVQTRKERKREKELSKMIQDPKGKAFICELFDSCFRTNDSRSLINQINFVLSEYGIPQFMNFWQKMAMRALSIFGKILPTLSASLIQKFVQNQVADVIAPGENTDLNEHLRKLQKEHVKINLNRLGEAILGENEANSRLAQNIEDLANPLIDVISVKISSICSQISHIDFETSLERLKHALRRLYREAALHRKFINLDMEEYKDLHLTVQLFQDVLSEPEFLQLPAGIALQSYIPDSHEIQEKLTLWAIGRCAVGGSPIKIRIVKGANLGMERVEASLKEWPQATYKQKAEVDASFKKMLHYGLQKKHAEAVHIGIGSHNLFDIAYALVLAAQQNLEFNVHIEMLAGMAPHLARVMPKIWKNVLLYLPCAQKEEFHNSIAYLMRRLDENTAPNNFLTHLFGLTSQSHVFEEQKELFSASCSDSITVSTTPRRRQNRNILEQKNDEIGHFTNEPDTDWSLAQNQQYAKEIIKEWQVNYHEINLVIGGHNLVSSEIAQGINPSRPDCKIHTYFLAQEYQVNVALEFAKNQGPIWAKVPLKIRLELLRKVANILRASRKKITGAMMQEVGKPIPEADSEISEAIDFIDYYTKDIETHAYTDKIFSKGKACLVLTPWNFPLSIPTSALVSALAAGYSVIFKPAPEAVLVGWMLAQCFWDAGISKECLQFITCRDEPIGSLLVTDPRIDTVILTGSTSTARSFLQKRNTLKLFAETGGKNSLIVTKIADRDLAVKDAVQSAFSYAGQKCSALSLLILEEEVYNDESFRRQLFDAASSLVVGPSNNLSTVVNPLIGPASPHLYKSLTTLDDGESWLLEPKQDSKNSQSWTPGIKLGVKPMSFMHQTELFGPILAVMCAKNLKEAIDFANATPYGLTAGIHTLDVRQQEYWKKHIIAGNCYINRPITGAIVARQPFGGTKASSFGIGMKVGGPNYLLQLGKCSDIPPQGLHEVSNDIIDLEGSLLQLGAKKRDSTYFYKAAASMAFWWDNYFTKPRTLRRLVGQDNILEYRAHPEIFILFQDADNVVDLLILLAAARTAGCKVCCVASFKQHRRLFRQGPLNALFQKFNWSFCTLQEASAIILQTSQAHIRALSAPPPDFIAEIAPILGCLDTSAPSANGRLELIHFVREVAISYDYHRYGNLMAREDEPREATR